jgi:hypothetical protein
MPWIAIWAIRREWNGRGQLPPLHIQPLNDRASIIYFVASLPPTWIAAINHATRRIPGTESDKFDLVVKIGLADHCEPRLTGDIFRLYLDASGMHMLLYFKPPQWASTRGGLEVYDSGQNLILGLPEPFADILSGSALYPHHPFIVLGKRLNSIWSRGIADPSARALFPNDVAQSMEARRRREAAIHGFLAALQNIGLGSVKVYASSASGYALKTITEDISLFGFTAVFPWAVQMLSAIRPNCAMLDGTFKILKPYVLAILHLIFANESIPIAIAVFPTETAESYRLLYAHVEEVLAHACADPTVLVQVPLVSDQGAGLRAFVRQCNLQWKHCHRHLIQTAGSNSQCGDWVARLLQCSTADQYDRVRSCILQEIEHLQALTATSENAHRTLESGKYEIVKMMLDPATADDDHQIDLWAKWLRLGCPTTSNAAESIHAKINAIADRGHTFLSRLAILKSFLFRRFTDRNHPERIRRRSSNRFLRRIHGNERIRIELKPEHGQFLFAVNTLVGEEGPRPDWTFPDFPVDFWANPPCEVEIVDWLPPESWKLEAIDAAQGEPLSDILPGIEAPDAEAVLAVNREASGGDLFDDPRPLDDDLIAAVAEAAHGGKDPEVENEVANAMIAEGHHDSEFSRIGWQIAFSIRRWTSKRQWDLSWDYAIAIIFMIGGQAWAEAGLSEPDGTEEGAEPAEPESLEVRRINAEATWRVRVLQAFAFV